MNLLGIKEDECSGGIGSTDMVNVSEEIPAIHPYVKITEKGTQLHSKEFTKASNSEKGYLAMLSGKSVSHDRG